MWENAVPIILSVLVHLILLLSVFDIYFKSPVVSVYNTHAPTYVAPARRIVLFVADGLRADALFSNGHLTPFLRGVMEEEGAWGVSHTREIILSQILFSIALLSALNRLNFSILNKETTDRVPTESRPGHVAIIAGMYEDPSAITKGWQENPADFDTVFNASRFTWGWGSPDILPMFAKGVTGDRMFAESYAPSFEDFSANDITKLDLWVFDKVESFFHAARQDVNLQLKLRQDKVILFLHLLGLDTNGHRNKPGSKEYMDNIRVVDEGVKRTVEVVDRYWRNDGRTAFLFTADHGMTDWGSHGAGMAHETETPLLAWGAGVRRARNISAAESAGQINKVPAPWALPPVERDDVEQADIAPLMSVLLGAAVPRNSVGKLPSGYLDMHPEHKVEAAVTVAKQMNEQLRSLRDRYTDARIHKPFPDLGAGAFEKRLERIGLHVRSGKYTEAQRLADGLFADALSGVEYYQRYFRLQLFAAVSASYVGLIVLIAVKLLKDFTPFGSGHGAGYQNARRLDAATFLTAVVIVIMSVSQNAPPHYLVYFLCPVAIWSMALRDAATLTAVRIRREQVLMFLVVLACLEVTVVSFFRRQALSAVIVTVALLLVRPSWSAWMKPLWMALNVCLCVFTFQPSVGKDRDNLLVFAGSVVSAVVFAIALSLSSSGGRSGVPSAILTSYLVLSGVCVWLASSSAPLVPIAVVHLASWFMFFTAIPAAIAFTKATLLPRLVALCMALQVCYILLSLSYEGLFLLCLMATLGTFLVMEHAASYLSHQSLSVLLVEPADARERNIVEFKDVLTAFVFLHFSVVSFFGTGNIASLNSFDPRSIACLVSIFSPFLMGGLLLFKVLLPFLVVACFMYAVRRVNRINSRALFLLVLLFSDILGLHFFFLVRDTGSWEEIGTSLSHYVIAEATVIFLQLLFVAAGWMLRFSGGGSGERERVGAALEGLEIDQSNRL